jgi:hypothetical protein
VPQQRQPQYPGQPQQYPGQPQQYPGQPQQYIGPDGRPVFPPGQLYVPHVWPQLAPAPPAPKRRWRWIVVGAVTVFLLACVLPVGGATAYLVARSQAGTLTARPTVAASASVRAARAPARRPKAGDSQYVFQEWMRDRVEDATAKQAQALLSGNLTGYLAMVRPAQSNVTTQLRKQYAGLRAMRVGSWGSEVLTMSSISGKEFKTEWRVRVAWHPCFGVAVCDEDMFTASTVWHLTTPDSAVLTGLTPDSAARAPRPWQVSDLVAKVGRRTVVATTRSYASVLPKLAEQAERAAAVADRFAYKGKPPARYVIFYAGPAEWKTWYGWEPPAWSGGVSIEVGRTSNIVLNGKELQGWFMDNLLRHEMTHASTIPAGTESRAWWLIEGIAEYAEMDGSAVSRYTALDDTRTFVQGSWDGHVTVIAPRDSDGDDDVSADYGIAFLAVRHLADRYGEEKMLAFFMAVVHDGRSEVAAAPDILGEDWSTVEKGCADFIRSAV